MGHGLLFIKLKGRNTLLDIKLMGNTIYRKPFSKVRLIYGGIKLKTWESPLLRVKLTVVYKFASLDLLSSSFRVSLPGIWALVYHIPWRYRELTPSFRSTIPIKLNCALNIDHLCSPSDLISSLDSEKFTRNIPFVRAYSFESFFLCLVCVLQRSGEYRAFQGCSPHLHFRKDLFTTSFLLLRGLHVIHQILMPCLNI